MKQLDYVKSDDGTFWMEFADFCTHFEDLYVCTFFDEPKWHTLEPLVGAWSKAKNTAGGCTNHATCGDNPQWAIKVERPTRIVIVLCQEDTRGQPNKPKVTCGMEVYANGGQRSTQRRLGKEVFSSTYTNLTELMLEGTLQPSDKAYTLLVTTFEPNVERRFDVKIFASEAVTVVPL